MDPLTNAISKASASTLRSVMLDTLSTSPEFRAAIEERMLVRKPVTRDEKDEEKKPPTKKRKTIKKDEGVEVEGEVEELTQVSRWILCKQCKEEFDTEVNQPNSCSFHPGTLEMDEDAFPDDDDLNAGYEMEIPGDWRVDEFPECFTWSCCQGDADARACQIKMHLGTV